MFGSRDMQQTQTQTFCWPTSSLCDARQSEALTLTDSSKTLSERIGLPTRPVAGHEACHVLPTPAMHTVADTDGPDSQGSSTILKHVSFAWYE